jgi:hypothetical protein
MIRLTTQIGHTWLDHDSPNYPNRVYLAGLILGPESQLGILGWTHTRPILDSESQLGILGWAMIRLTTKLGDL